MSKNLGVATLIIKTAMRNRRGCHFLYGRFWWTADCDGRRRTKTDWKCFLGSLKMQERWLPIRNRLTYVYRTQYIIHFISYTVYYILYILWPVYYDVLFASTIKKLIHAMLILKSTHGLKRMLNSTINSAFCKNKN